VSGVRSSLAALDTRKLKLELGFYVRRRWPFELGFRCLGDISAPALDACRLYVADG
jgi:hypothetical protein